MNRNNRIILFRSIALFLILTVLWSGVIHQFVDLAIQAGKDQLRHGTLFFYISYRTSILLGVVVAMSITVYNVLAYLKFSKLDPNQFLLPWQKYKLKIAPRLKTGEVLDILNKRLLRRKRWKLKHHDEKSIHLTYRYYLWAHDRVELEKRAGYWLFKSGVRLNLVDGGRNYRHIRNIAQEIVDKMNQDNG